MRILHLTITWTVLLVLGWNITDANGAALDEREQQIAEAEAFIANRPATPEAMKLRVDLAAYYRHTGRFSRSLEHWSQTWMVSRTC